MWFAAGKHSNHIREDGKQQHELDWEEQRKS